MAPPSSRNSAPDRTPQAPAVAAMERAKAQEQFLADITKDFRRLQAQKSRRTGGVEARILLSTAFDWGEHYIRQDGRGITVEKQDENKLYLIFNLINQRKNRLIGRLTHSGLQFGAQPSKKDPKALADAETVDKVVMGLDRKLDQPSLTWELLDWLVKGGVAFEHVTWVPNATIEPIAQFDDQNQLLFEDTHTGEVLPEPARNLAVQNGEPPERFIINEEVELVGDVSSEILSPLTVFVDHAVKSIETLAPDQAVYVAKMRTEGWIQENYGELVDLSEINYDKELKIVTTMLIQDGEATASLFLKDMIPTVQGQVEEDDPDLAVVVDRYQPVSKSRPHGRYTAFIPDKLILFDGDNPYPEIPLVDFHFTPVTTTFWTKDYITDLIAPQRFLNKRLSQLGEQSNASIYDKLLLGGGLTEADIPADYPGVVKNGLNEQGAPNVARLPGPSIPGWFPDSIKMVLGLFNDIAGGSDLTENAKFPGQLRGPMAVPMLQEIMDTEWGPLYFHIAQRMARVKQMRLNRVKQYYPPVRTMHYTDRNQRDETLVFHAEKILRAGTDFNISVEPNSIIPELRALREARVRERLQSPLAILYTDERTGKLDKSKIAQDLRMGDYAREDRESESRKFAQQIIEKLWQGQPAPPVMPFWDHPQMMDELEGEMMTTEFLGASPQVQQLFQDRWQQHLRFLQAKQDAQENSMKDKMIQNAVAQATQQAAAKAAAQAVDEAMEQVHAQQQTRPSAQELVAAEAARRAQPPRPPQAVNRGSATTPTVRTPQVR